LQMRTADNIPVGAKRLAERSYQVRPILEGTNRGRHFETKTPANGSDTSRSQAPVPPSTLRQPSLAPGTQDFNTGIPRERPSALGRHPPGSREAAGERARRQTFSGPRAF